MVSPSSRIGKVHHIILRCEGEARASKERTPVVQEEGRLPKEGEAGWLQDSSSYA
jgi:hypothetical protein